MTTLSMQASTQKVDLALLLDTVSYSNCPKEGGEQGEHEQDWQDDLLSCSDELTILHKC